MRSLFIVLAFVLGMPSSIAGERDAPGFELAVLQGDDKGELAAHRGKIVVIEFWATYCGWCRSTHPRLARLAKRHKDITVLGISAQSKKRLVRYLTKKRLGFTILHDRGARVSRRYGARATPTVAVVGRRGKLRFLGSGRPAVWKAIRLAESLAHSP